MSGENKFVSRDTLLACVRSWAVKDSPVCPMEDILAWIDERNRNTKVTISKTTLEKCPTWFYDAGEGCIRNGSRSFFSIAGLRGPDFEQPVILQNEIGYLGILCKEIGGVLHFLMQAKIEPGNVNCVQVSPTIQATKSNFTQKHGGRRPEYLDYFLNASKYEIIVDQIQSEQSSRFLKKRNRNIIIRVDGDVPVLPTHRWMTLGQIKRLMRKDNLVNMDARTVLSCIPFSKVRMKPEEKETYAKLFEDGALFRSAFEGEEDYSLPAVFQYINNKKMFSEESSELVALDELKDWEMRCGEFVCRHPYPFKVVFCDIFIEGREVQNWAQPCFEALGIATFGLVCVDDGGLLKFVVRAAHEVGCFDCMELGPTVQHEAVASFQNEDAMTGFFWERLASREGIVFDHLLSEEGGRFYHEQNRNVLLRVKAEELPPLPDGYFLLDYKTLNELVQVNNTLNIQLRNLLSLLEV